MPVVASKVMYDGKAEPSANVTFEKDSVIVIRVRSVVEQVDNERVVTFAASHHKVFGYRGLVGVFPTIDPTSRLVGIGAHGGEVLARVVLRVLGVAARPVLDFRGAEKLPMSKVCPRTVSVGFGSPAMCVNCPVLLCAASEEVVEGVVARVRSR